MGLGQPLRAGGLTGPDGQGVIVERFDFGLGLCIAGVGAEYVVGGEGRVWCENADLKVAKFIGGQLAVFEEDKCGIERLDGAIDLNVVGGEEAADGIKIALCKRGPEVLFEGCNFDGGRGGGGLDLYLG